MASDRIAWLDSDNCWGIAPDHGDHITLPLDASQYDDAAVEAASKAAYRANNTLSDGTDCWSQEGEDMREAFRKEQRASLAAYANHVAGVSRGE